MTYSNCKTENGLLTVYVDQGNFTDDPIEDEFFGCGGVAKIPNLQRKLLKLGRNGFRHHTAAGEGNLAAAMREAFSIYLNYNIVD